MIRTRAVKKAMPLITNCLGVAEGAFAQKPRHSRPFKPVLLNWQGMSTHPEMEDSSEFIDGKAADYNRALQNTCQDLRTSANMCRAWPSLKVLCVGRCAPLPRLHSHGQAWLAEIQMHQRTGSSSGKGEAMPKLMNCLWTPAAQLAKEGSCRASKHLM